MQPRAGWVPAGSRSPSRVGLLRPSVASSLHAGTADWTHWSPPALRANTTGAKKLQLSRREGFGSRTQCRTPRSPGAASRRARTPARAHSLGRAHRGPHTCSSPPPPGASGWGGSGPRALSAASPAALPCPPATPVFFVAVNCPGPGAALSSPS